MKDSFGIRRKLKNIILTDDEKSKLKLRRLASSVGHVVYSWKYEPPSGCTCEACNRTWNLDNTYILVKDLIEDLLDREDRWVIKYKE